MRLGTKHNDLARSLNNWLAEKGFKFLLEFFISTWSRKVWTVFSITYKTTFWAYKRSTHNNFSHFLLTAMNSTLDWALCTFCPNDFSKLLNEIKLWSTFPFIPIPVSFSNARWIEIEIGSVYSSSVWPDFAKCHHFGTVLKVLSKFLWVYLVFGKILILLWEKCFTSG